MFEIVNKLFIKSEKVYGDFYYKKHIIEKFIKLKINILFFNIFGSKFIKLAIKFKFIKEILLQKFIHKLFV